MALTIVEQASGVNSAIDCSSVTSPAANAVLCDSGALGAGTYVCQVTTFLSGTADAAGGGSNIYINVGGSGNPVTGGRTIGHLPSIPALVMQRFRVSVQAGEHIFLCVGNTAPTTGAVYNASLSASRGWHLLSDT